MNDEELEEYLNSLTDAEFKELMDSIEQEIDAEETETCVSRWISHEMEKNPDMKRDQAIAIAYSKCKKAKKDSIAWFAEDSNFGTVNKLNNVLKIPVILAREMVQIYDHGKSKHFKPYEELKKAIDGMEDLPVIIEHKNWVDDDVVGYVKEFRADDDDRSIKGVAYLTESALPEAIADTLKKNIVVPVSIGFWADLGDGGEFNGESYDHVQRDMAFNHLAICIRSIARCPPNQCGLNLDSEKYPEMNGEILINKGNYYYYINQEDKESEIQNQEIGDNMGDIRNFENEKYIKEPSAGITTSKSAIAGAVGPDLRALFSKLLDWVGNIPKEEIRRDAEDLLISLINQIDGEKMGDNEDLAKLELRITQLEDSIKEKDEIISKYEEEKRKALIADIKKFKAFEDSELDGKCIRELEIIADTVSKFEPSMEKAKVLPKPKQTAKAIEDARMSPFVFGRDPYKEDEE